MDPVFKQIVMRLHQRVEIIDGDVLLSHYVGGDLVARDDSGIVGPETLEWRRGRTHLSA